MHGLGVIPWPAEAIWEQIEPLLAGFTIEVLPEIDSTNTELMRRAKAGRIEPILLIAEKQTAGRGRLGREWHDLSERTEARTSLASPFFSLPSLTFSLGIPLAPADWSGLSLAVGVSIAHNLHGRIGLKWPNDLWLDDRKLAGILIETCAMQDNAHQSKPVNNPINIQRYVVIGVGINITEPSSNPTAALPTLASLRTPAAWLQELLSNTSAADALQRIALNLIQTILTFAEHGFAPFQARFNELDVLKNRRLSVINNLSDADISVKITGTGCGVNPRGELQIQTALGIETINSSEVSVKPL